uniref:Uncharacterized protein n=1 Tax=Cyprinodon variegatus TaxID=28743 RepID=A0A3Q2DJJ0_CYPVA
MEAIISAAETGFAGSLSSGWAELTRPAAYIGTMTGCFRCPDRLTMFLVSMPRQQSRTLLQCEPPHWYRSPRASWTSRSCVQTSPCVDLQRKRCFLYLCFCLLEPQSASADGRSH